MLPLVRDGPMGSRAHGEPGPARPADLSSPCSPRPPAAGRAQEACALPGQSCPRGFGGTSALGGKSGVCGAGAAREGRWDLCGKLGGSAKFLISLPAVKKSLETCKLRKKVCLPLLPDSRGGDG